MMSTFLLDSFIRCNNYMHNSLNCIFWLLKATIDSKGKHITI